MRRLLISSAQNSQVRFKIQTGKIWNQFSIPQQDNLAKVTFHTRNLVVLILTYQWGNEDQHCLTFWWLLLRPLFQVLTVSLKPEIDSDYKNLLRTNLNVCCLRSRVFFSLQNHLDILYTVEFLSRAECNRESGSDSQNQFDLFFCR